MSLSDVHYEVFLKRDRNTPWRLAEARETKEDALALATKLLDEHPSASIRVSKEKWEAEDGGFRTYTIFEAGEKFHEDDRAQRTAEIPCRTPADLANAHARETIARALEEWLKRSLATPLELLHRVDLVEQLEAAGTEYQHAVQKVAIASASDQQANVQKFIKQINDLLKRAIEELYAAHRAGAFVKIERGGLAAVLGQLANAGAKTFRLRGAIALTMSGASDWRSKFARVLDLADEAAKLDAAVSEWPLDVLGEFIEDLVENEAARATLLGVTSDHGDELNAFTDMLRAAEGQHMSDNGRRLARAFAKGRFVDAQRSIARHVLKGLKSPKRLKPGNIRDEIKLNRSIADRLIYSVGRLISQEELVEAFVFRSGRLLDSESVEALLDHARTPADEFFSLIELEDNIVGDANKAKLAGYIRARQSSLEAENHFLKSAEPPTRKLAELAGVRRALDGASFAEDDAEAIAAKIDRFAIALEARMKLLDQVVRRAPGPLEGAVNLLQLFEKGLLPRGALENQAQERARTLLRSPEAQAAMADGDPTQMALAQEVVRMLNGEAREAPAADKAA